MSTLPRFERPYLADLIRRLRERPRFVQIVTGPRQVGKTTLARQAMAALDLPAHYASADDPVPRDPAWIEAQWEAARAGAFGSRRGSILVLDEVQKITGWSEEIKRLWDTGIA